MGARGRSSRYCSSKTATRAVEAVDFGLAVRGFLGRRGLSGDAGEGETSWMGKSDGVADEEKSCRNWRRGEGPGCFGGFRACPYCELLKCELLEDDSVQRQFYKRKRLVRTCRLGFGPRNSVSRGTRAVLGLARRVDGSVLVIFWRRMREEPGLLFFDHFRCLVV